MQNLEQADAMPAHQASRRQLTTMWDLQDEKEITANLRHWKPLQAPDRQMAIPIQAKVGSEAAVEDLRSSHGKSASQLLNDWVKELDGQSGPVVSVSIHELIALQIADMQLNNCEPLNVLDTERKANKHLGAFFAEHDFTVPLKKVDIKRYQNAST